MRRGWWLYAVPTLLGTAAYTWLSGNTRVVWYDALSVSVVAALLAGARRVPRAERLPWYLFAAGQLCYSIADISWNAVYAHLGYVPTPSLVDAAYLAYYPFVAIGLVLLARRRSGRGQALALVDALTAGTGVALVMWVVARPSVVATGMSAAAGVVTLAYPAADLVLLVLALRMAMGPGRRTRAFRLLLASILLTTVTDLLYLATTTRGWDLPSAVTDIGWLLGYITFGCAALHPTMRSLGQPSAEQAEGGVPLRRKILLATSGLFAPGVLALGPAVGEPADVAAFAVGATLLYLLLLSRLAGVARRQERSERRFRSIALSSSDLMLITDPDGTITWCSQSIERICGYPVAQLMGRQVTSFLRPGDAGTLDLLAAATGSAACPLGDWRMRVSDGSDRVFQVTGRNLLDDPAVGGLLLAGPDVTERRQMEDELREQALHDTLTGLANRVLFVDRLRHALVRRRAGGPELAVLFIDLDDFKTVNDSLGHQVGDELLVAVARRLRSSVRSADTAARFGGDEFALLLVDPIPDEVLVIAQRIQERLAQPVLLGGHEVSVTASVGIATSETGYSEAADVLRDADTAMYHAKATERGTASVFDPEMHMRATGRLKARGELRTALAEHQFVVHYQPIVALDGSGVGAFEALVRWQHPE
ncbi:MAG: hypothetical protein V7603_3550, partial [Micromonosporaceae bacterium]